VIIDQVAVIQFIGPSTARRDNGDAQQTHFAHQHRGKMPRPRWA